MDLITWYATGQFVIAGLMTVGMWTSELERRLQGWADEAPKDRPARTSPNEFERRLRAHVYRDRVDEADTVARAAGQVI